MQGFFMSIHKPTLWAMLHRFIKQKYFGKDKSLILWLTKLVILHHPEENCIKKSSEELWDKLDTNKSLFTCGKDFGLPIGNLTSQCFANFYLGLFDIMMSNKFIHYGRYVDDFYIITREKQTILDNINVVRNHLQNTLYINLHPKKLYIQHYTKGVKFIGAVIKRDRTYISNSTVSNIYRTIHRFNDNIHKDDAFKFIQSMNSYFGFLKHHRSYAIRRRLVDMINSEWYLFIKINTTYTKIKKL